MQAATARSFLWHEQKPRDHTQTARYKTYCNPEPEHGTSSAFRAIGLLCRDGRVPGINPAQGCQNEMTKIQTSQRKDDYDPKY
jgi:hypothetical protein